MNNDPIRERLLALAFRDGIGTPPRQDEFVAWLNRASQHGDAEAMYLLSEVYADGQGVARDEQRSKLYLFEAAEHGHALSAARVGNDSAAGSHNAKAAHWLRIALDKAARESVFLPEDNSSYRGRQLALAS